MINIGFYVPKLNGGGAERVFVNLANEMSKNENYNVFIFVSKMGGEYDDLVSNSVTFVSLGNVSLLKSIIPLAKVLKQYSITHLLCGMPFPNFLGVIQKIVNPKLHLTLVEHNDLSVQLREGTGGWRKKITPIIIKYSYFIANKVICVSGGVKDFVLSCDSRLINKTEVIYNPIYSNELVNKSLEPLDDDDFVKSDLTLITVARLNRQKNLSLFIDVCNEIKSRDSSFKAYVLGEGEERPKLEEKIKSMGLCDHVKLVGFKKNPYNYVRESDVFLLTSKWEGFGNVIVESASCNTPVVSVNCPSGPAEVIESLNCGIIVDSYCPIYLADKVVECNLNEYSISVSDLESYSIKSISNKYTNVIFG
ncbi:glycosyltransferase [Vibrio splendidus]